jgi:hypothetical protein
MVKQGSDLGVVWDSTKSNLYATVLVSNGRRYGSIIPRTDKMVDATRPTVKTGFERIISGNNAVLISA